MGYIRHNAIVVTSWEQEYVTKAAKAAIDIGLQVIGPSEEAVNGYSSILICPDGSKEGWEESKIGDDRRKAFRGWLNNQRYEDGSSAYEWFEAAYGSDDKDAEIEYHGYSEE